MEKRAAYKEAFLKNMLAAGEQLAAKGRGLLDRANNSYVMDAVRANRLQNIKAVKDEPVTLHGTVLNSFVENGAIGAGMMRSGINKARVFLGDVDTGLGALAIGKKGMTDPTHSSLRKTLFTFEKDNYVKVDKYGPKPSKKVPSDPNNLHILEQQTRPSISAPLHAVSGVAVPMLAMAKGMELLHRDNGVQGAQSVQGQEQVPYN